jgi:hypothetical protein
MISKISTMENLPKTLTTHRGKVRAACQIVQMQDVLFRGIIESKDLSKAAAAAKAWECLEDRKRILQGKPLVKPVEAKTKGKSKPFASPMPEPVQEPAQP